MWLWVVRTGDHAAVFTCFPQKYEEAAAAEGRGDGCFHGIADLRRGVVDEVNGRGEAWVAEPEELVAVVLDQAVNAMLQVRNEQSLDFLGVFRMAIGKAVSVSPRPPSTRGRVKARRNVSCLASAPTNDGKKAEAQSFYFRQFQAKLSSTPHDIRDRATKREEVKLALEIADILDELNSIDRLFEAQADALAAMADNIRLLPGMFQTLVERVDELVGRDIAGYRKQVGRMMEDARRTKNNVSVIPCDRVGEAMD